MESEPGSCTQWSTDNQQRPNFRHAPTIRDSNDINNYNNKRWESSWRLSLPSSRRGETRLTLRFLPTVHGPRSTPSQGLLLTSIINMGGFSFSFSHPSLSPTNPAPSNYVSSGLPCASAVPPTSDVSWRLSSPKFHPPSADAPGLWSRSRLGF
ncbi:hypothetical protein CMUS01_07816 [Colletotrichum musicola]|uniref:Uncharacterized protein n=1 Tax=Colletotrichum musicola TaxID=2175873 RepID=A0A8H6KFQ1_9PEZI|nr:hypothetical protein CMUS01_07816 [Colletotrichum musicola]